MDEYHIIIDLTSRGISLEFLIPIPFLLIGLFLTLKGRMINEAGKGFLAGNATIIGIVWTLFSIIMIVTMLIGTIKDRVQFIETYLTPKPIEKIGNIKDVKRINGDSLITGVTVDQLEYQLLNPIEPFDINGKPRILIGTTAKLLYQPLDNSNIIVKLEVTDANNR